MRQFFLSMSLCLFLIAGWLPAARACINDREVGPAEREFKSNYMENAAPESTPRYRPSEEHQGTPLALMGLGAALFVGAVVTNVKKPQ